jgi:hypothetical protein
MPSFLCKSKKRSEFILYRFNGRQVFIIDQLKYGVSGMLILILIFFTATVSAAGSEPVTIEADAGVNYDVEKNITTATKNVKVISEGILIEADTVRIEAQKLNYESSSGLVEATGNVRLKDEHSQYFTQRLTYSVLDSTGKSGPFTSVLHGEPRDFFLSGQDLRFNQNEAEFSNVTLTRCPRKKPEYTLTAQRISIVDTKISMRSVVLRIKGIPVCYFPFLTFYTDRSMPKLVPGWDEGLEVTYDILLSSSYRSDWNFKGELSSQGDEANLGLGLRTRNGNYLNQLDISYYFLDGYWKIADQYLYDWENFSFTIDGSRDFSSQKESQFGLDLTRKYAATSLGRWRAGVSARWVAALDGANAEYGGIYSGFRLDYQPLNNVTLSYLGIRSHSDDDYRDLMEDFGTGGNGLYRVEIPLAKTYKLEINGTYNFTASKWYHQVYRLTMGDCCLKPTISYDQADQTWAASLIMDF